MPYYPPPSAGGGGSLDVKDEGTTVVTAATAINFVGAGVTASNVGGVAQVSIPGGGGGSALSGSTILDFGAGAFEASVTVAEASTATGQLIRAWVNPSTTTNNTADDHLFEQLDAIAHSPVAGVGFTLRLTCRNGRAFGKYSVAWSF